MRRFTDSKLEKLRLERIDALLMLLSIPMPSVCEKIIHIADINLISELATAKVFSNETEAVGMQYEVIPMADMGDLREGVMPQIFLPYVIYFAPTEYRANRLRNKPCLLRGAHSHTSYPRKAN